MASPRLDAPADFIIFVPAPPTWGLRFSADKSVCFAMHKPPALLHRWAQRLLLGIRYDRINLRGPSSK